MILIKDATIVNEGEKYIGSILVNGDKIEKIFRSEIPSELLSNKVDVINAKGKLLIPGVIDDQVHFRQPGLTHKGDIASESKAAIAGGVTSFMEMPNTKPPTTTIEELDKKFDIAAETAYANYSFYLGATNENIKELNKVDKKQVCGVKVFMGSSTGNMLVDDKKTLEAIFSEVDNLIATHCEKEEIVRSNIEIFKNKYGENIPVKYHPLIRSEEACYRSSYEAAELASKYGAQLHILHLSTAKELSIFDAKPLTEKKITGEACVHHLWFSDEDYETFGNLIKWNPAIKTANDRDKLLQGLIEGKLDVVATDHAPHLMSEKQGDCLQAASGGPLVQHSLQVMLQLAHQGKISVEKVVEKMCHNPSILFRIDKRGFIREQYYADLVLIDEKEETVNKENILYKCQWSPFENQTFNYKVDTVLLNGEIAYTDGIVNEDIRGKKLSFNR